MSQYYLYVCLRKKKEACTDRKSKLTPKGHLQQALSHHLYLHKQLHILILCSLPSLSTPLMNKINTILILEQNPMEILFGEYLLPCLSPIFPKSHFNRAFFHKIVLRVNPKFFPIL